MFFVSLKDTHSFVTNVGRTQFVLLAIDRRVVFRLPGHLSSPRVIRVIFDTLNVSTIAGRACAKYARPPTQNVTFDVNIYRSEYPSGVFVDRRRDKKGQFYQHFTSACHDNESQLDGPI